MKTIWPSLAVLVACAFAAWIFWPAAKSDRATSEVAPRVHSGSTTKELPVREPQQNLPAQNNDQSADNAETTAEPMHDAAAQEPLPLGYAQLKNDDFYAAMQLWEARSLDSLAQRGFFKESASFCALASEPSRIARVLQYNSGPLQALYQWATMKAREICQDFRARPLVDADLQRVGALMKHYADERAKVGNQIGPWNDQKVILADSAEELWMLSGEGFQGGVGREIFDFRPQAIRTGLDAEYNLSLAQRMAITRIRCEMTHACGPEQLDSILVCMRFQMCGPGVSVEQVWSNVASPHQRKAADAIYQIYSEARRSARAHRAGGSAQ